MKKKLVTLTGFLSIMALMFILTGCATHGTRHRGTGGNRHCALQDSRNQEVSKNPEADKNIGLFRPGLNPVLSLQMPYSVKLSEV